MADAILERINQHFDLYYLGPLRFCDNVNEEFDMLAKNVMRQPFTRRDCVVAQEVLQRYFSESYPKHKTLLTKMMKAYPSINEELEKLDRRLACLSTGFGEPITKLTMAKRQVEYLKQELFDAEKKVEELEKTQTL